MYIVHLYLGRYTVQWINKGIGAKFYQCNHSKYKNIEEKNGFFVIHSYTQKCYLLRLEMMVFFNDECLVQEERDGDSFPIHQPDSVPASPKFIRSS